jgi:hypothetical protein
VDYKNNDKEEQKKKKTKKKMEKETKRNFPLSKFSNPLLIIPHP